MGGELFYFLKLWFRIDDFAFIRSIVAIGGQGFAVIASDTRLSSGFAIYTRDQGKLTTLTNSAVLGATGCWCDVLSLTKLIQARMKVRLVKPYDNCLSNCVNNLC